MRTSPWGKDGDKDGQNRASDGAKERVTLVLEPAVLEKFRSAGEDWQDLINRTLREALEDSPDR